MLVKELHAVWSMGHACGRSTAWLVEHAVRKSIAWMISWCRVVVF